MSGTTPAVARVAHGTLQRLRAFLTAEKNRAGELLAGTEPTPGADAALRAEACTRIRQRLERLRERGDLLDTVDAALTHGIRVELAGRGWDHHWPPVQAGPLRAPGRTHHPAGSGLAGRAGQSPAPGVRVTGHRTPLTNLLSL
ncbi:hypothetical protein HS041_27515 [Planomonospora sp. ID67723]|uniref:hypothetical protein n=1 Tax=Planomonospora sp. ID67723 TaxID=2738134 RepID=UPI0018C38768|nr:hypothetical protein [Planomonospora sp. ID67723]MBG0831491.1 hypothetical protein [Planomonospora sp. ID67723]